MKDTNHLTFNKKLIILHILKKAEKPLSNSQIAQIVFEKNYMDYFSFQAYLGELFSSGLLDMKKENSISKYFLSTKGIEILELFYQQIPNYIINEIEEYYQNNENNLLDALKISADYFEGDDNDFLIKCGMYENGNVMMEINVSVATKEQAIFICENWKNKVNNIYSAIFENLTN